MTHLPNPPNYQFKPLTRQFDDGFGLMGDAFNNAAVRLEDSSREEQFLNSSLPIAFLYRHAIELYLKSVITVLHRNLQIPFGPNPATGAPLIHIDDKWVPIYRVHDVGDLYRHFNQVLTEHVDQLQVCSVTDWSTMSTDLADWIAEIADLDRQSTLFRYPGAGDPLKSDFKESLIVDIWSRLGPDDPPAKAFIEFNAHDEVVGAFRIELSELERTKELLRKTANELSAIHFACRCDLAGGM